MIEVRWVEFSKNRQLEYRFITPNVDASGGLCPPGEWSNWHVVPTVDADTAAYEDLRASGGIFPEAYDKAAS